MIWLLIMIPVSALFSGIGIYAMTRKKPMWFWSGSEVHEEELTNVAGFNKANGILWLSFSAAFWIATVVGFLHMAAGGVVLIAACVIGIPVLPIAYGKIYKRYKRD